MEVEHQESTFRSILITLPSILTTT